METKQEKKSLVSPIVTLAIGAVLIAAGTVLWKTVHPLLALLVLAGIPVSIVGLVKLIKTIVFNAKAGNAQ